MRNLDITTLRSLVAVADQGGVTRAATALNLTQSAVSMQIKRLEEMLDLTLFDRANRRVSLTASGEQLVGYARRMLDLNDEVVGRLTEEIFEGELALGVPHDIVYPVVPRVLKQFNAAYPRVKVNLRSSSTIKLREALARGEVDVILTTEEVLGEGGETLTEMMLRWTGAPAGVSWKRRPLRLAFCRQCIFRPMVLRKLEAAGIDWEMAVDSEDDRAVEALVSADLAVGALLEDSMPPHLEAIHPGGALPELGVQKINLYARAGGDEVRCALMRMLRQGFGALTPPVLSPV
ncbi:LysR family transcriptional regulator [Roseovarius sp. BRH_c41]|jgi:DNA-binding transcriptional LysR family regulator|uniref:LysR family transcriptional regulator n=1 Tax=Roseovarius sp. BRH_c41 TaxID=1629709 RepID=UPI0005F26346|nr:LysR family transcriptional regulator [Roseovarius sp. BRH_c41]KJS42677.1 MAG: LysR family transcriptional regulator [Roseovarius sp. BRH_c41]